MSLNKSIIIIMVAGLFALSLSCNNKTPTTPTQTAVLSGQVYQESNGLYYFIPDAEITLGNYSTTSDTAGKYQIELPLGEYSIMCSHDKFDTTTSTIINIKRDKTYLIRMTGPTYTVTGIVTDTMGTILSGANVELENLRTTTNANGRYIFNDIPLGKREIKCDFVDFGASVDTLEVIDNDIEKNIILTQTRFQVSGIVTNTTGTIILGAIVELDNKQDITDMNGSYSFSGISSGSTTIRCTYDDYYDLIDTIFIDNSNLEYNFSIIRKSFQVSGTVSHPLDGLLSGVEVVLDDTLYDTTDAKGEFQFDNIYSGNHQLEFYSSVYDYELYDFYLSGGNIYKEILLEKLYVDTLWIEKDAEVFVDSDDYNYQDSNYGEDSILPFLGYFAEYLVYDTLPPFYGYHIVSYHISRVFMKMDEINSNLSDSILLILPFTKYNYQRFGEIRFTSVSESWDELGITWNNQPSVTSEQIFYDTWEGLSNKIAINITNNLSLFTNPNGFRISFTDESCEFCDFGLQLYSSEYPDSSKRPHILLYKSE